MIGLRKTEEDCDYERRLQKTVAVDDHPNSKLCLVFRLFLSSRLQSLVNFASRRKCTAFRSGSVSGTAVPPSLVFRRFLLRGFSR